MARAGASDIPSCAASCRVQCAAWRFTNPSRAWAQDSWQAVHGDRDADTRRGLGGALGGAGANADTAALVNAAQAYADSGSHACDGRAPPHDGRLRLQMS